MSDAEFLHTQWRDTINQFKEDYDKWEKHTLKDYLMRCAEIVSNQINNKVIDMDDMKKMFREYVVYKMEKDFEEMIKKYLDKKL